MNTAIPAATLADIRDRLATPEPQRPAGFVQAHTERRARSDQEVASQFVAQAPLATPPDAPRPVVPRSTESVTKLVTYTASGAMLETFVGREPRPPVDPSLLYRDRMAAQRDRVNAANLRHNRRVRHLATP